MLSVLKNIKIIILLLAVCQLLNISCSKHIQPEPASRNQAGEAPLKDFKYSGTENAPNSIIPPNSKLPLDKIDSHGEDTKLKQFFETGFEKKLDNSNVKPDEIIKTARKFLAFPIAWVVHP